MQYISVTAITGGINEPSSRFRVRQYIKSLADYNIKVIEHIPFITKSGNYWYHKHSLPIQLVPQFFIAGLRLMSRFPAIYSSYSTDITWIQREFFTAFSTAEGLTKRPRLFDVDDAIWLRLKLTSGFAKRIVNKMDGLICGNQWVADYFSDCGIRTWVIPTGIDTMRWVPPTFKSEQPFYYGWIGTSGNLRYLYDIEPALKVVLEELSSAKLLIVSDRQPEFSTIAHDRIHFMRWSQKIEVDAVQRMNVGLMPLRDSDWERGKCAYKMLTYMAVGIPVIVSPVGMNVEVLKAGQVGFGANKHSEWTEALITLYKNPTLRKCMGRAGQQIVMSHYSVNVIVPKLAAIFKQISQNQ